MAINKDFLVKNGLQVGGNTQLTGSLTAAGLSYPVSDGDQYMAMVTDGNGNLSFNNVDTVESDVTNQTGSLIPKGTPVYQTGAAGNTLTIAPSDASNAATMPAIGVTGSDIANGDTGRVIHFGYIKGVDTSAFSEGDRIYVADGGGYQEGRPTGEGNVVQFLGVVTKVHATNGSGVVFGGGRAHAVPNLNDGNIFIGDNTGSPVTATLDTDLVPEGTNQYFTTARAISAIEGSTNLTIDGGTLYIDTANNYIGINDTSPQQALDVTGAIAIGGTTVIDSGGEVVTAQLKDSGVTTGSYGSASLVPIITVDSKGRITSASTTSVAGVSNFTFNSTTDVLTISTADGGSFPVDISNITVGGSMDGPLANLTVKYQSTAPSTPSQGQIYFDSLNQLLMIYTGSSWVQTIPSSSGSGGTSGVTDAVATFQKYTYTLSSTTNAVSGASEQVVDAGDFTIGKSYQIRTVGDTDFTAIGASANTVGTVFVATGVGEGTGDAYTYLAYSTAGAQNVEVFVNGVKQVEGAANDYVATTGTAVTFTYNIPSGSVVDVQIYELLTQDAFYLKSETYTTTEVNSQISTAVSAYLPLTGGTLTGALSGTSATLTGGLTVDTNTLVVDNVNNRVGIGTASPNRPLSIVDTNAGIGVEIRNANTLNDKFSRLNITNTVDVDLQFYLTGVGATDKYAMISPSTNTDLRLGVAGTSRLTVDTTGNVGIGTDAPLKKLEVTGDIQLDADNANLWIKSGAVGTNGFINWTFNTDSTVYNKVGMDYDTRASTGFHIDAGYPITIDATASGGKAINFAIGGSTKAVINGTGLVGIGTDTPSTNLHLKTSGATDFTMEGGTNSRAQIFFKNDAQQWNVGINSIGEFVVYDSTNAHEKITARATETVLNDNAANLDFRVKTQADGYALFVDASANNIIFGSDTGNSMYNGGSANPGIQFELTYGTIVHQTNGNANYYMSKATGYTNSNFNVYSVAGASVGSINTDGSGITFNTTSDRRLKDNIVAITDGKEKLLAMKPVTHTWVADPDAPAVHGFIAQEMQEVVPEAVSGDPESDEMMSMDYGRITPVIVAALQDALKEIEELKERIKTLEAK